MYDFNLIIEEFPQFYPKLTPRLQTELINQLFSEFKHNFKHFFDSCETGFINEFIINMYCRVTPDKQILVTNNKKVREICFIKSG